MSKFVWKIIVCLHLGFSFFLVGCLYKSKPALFIDKEFQKKPVDFITLLPVVDVRKDKTAAEIETEQLEEMRERIAAKIAGKGYSVISLPGFTNGKPPSPPEIAEMDSKELAKLGQADSNVLFIFFLEDLSSSYVVVAKTAVIETSAVLVERESGHYLWKGKCVESPGQAGLLGGLLPFLDEAIRLCTEKMFNSFPRRIIPGETPIDLN